VAAVSSARALPAPGVGTRGQDLRAAHADEIEEIGRRAGAMLDSGAERDLCKAVGLVAAEMLDARTADDGAR
jgi:hypothetical protein